MRFPICFLTKNLAVFACILEQETYTFLVNGNVVNMKRNSTILTILCGILQPETYYSS